MAYGLHWEWRGFGTLDPTSRQRIEDLPRLFPTDIAGVDSYYWYPGCDTNLKVREWGARAGVKLKRMRDIDAESGLELWLEDEGEDYPFPLRPDAAVAVAEALGLDVSPPPRPLGRCSLLTLLQQARPDLVVVAVQKRRSLRRWSAGDREVLVEIAEIRSPEQLTSVGIEDCAALGGAASASDVAAARSDVLKALRALGLPGALTPLSYLAAVGRWAGGGTLLTP